MGDWIKFHPRAIASYVLKSKLCFAHSHRFPFTVPQTVIEDAAERNDFRVFLLQLGFLSATNSREIREDLFTPLIDVTDQHHCGMGEIVIIMLVG